MKTSETRYSRIPVQRSGWLQTLLSLPDHALALIGAGSPLRFSLRGWLGVPGGVSPSGSRAGPSPARMGATSSGGAGMAAPYRVNPKFRAYGRARIDLASRAQDREDWENLWKKPMYPFPFTWQKGWKPCLEYRVEDFPAEVGFFIDVLGFQVNSLGSDQATFSTPDESLTFSVTPATQEGEGTPPESLNIRFMVADILETARELELRGVTFEQSPEPYRPGSDLFTGYFRTPNGICIDLWGEIDRRPDNRIAGSPANGQRRMLLG